MANLYSDQAGIGNTKSGGMENNLTQRTNAQTIYSDTQFENMKTPITQNQTQASATQGQTAGMQGQTTGMQGQTTSGGVQATVTALFRTRKEAEQAVDELKRQGFSDQEINVISKDKGRSGRSGEDDDVMDGALTGGTLGGIGGLILGAGALAIPGVGPIIAAGPIAAALTGAVAGGVAGALIDWGIPADVSRRYEQNISHGDSLVFVRTSGAKAQQAQGILRNSGAKSVESH